MWIYISDGAFVMKKINFSAWTVFRYMFAQEESSLLDGSNESTDHIKLKVNNFIFIYSLKRKLFVS